MSADNGIYIAKFDSELYRVIHARAIENIELANTEEEKLAVVKAYFQGSKVFSNIIQASDYAQELANECKYLEYGIVIMRDTLPEFERTPKKEKKWHLKYENGFKVLKFGDEIIAMVAPAIGSDYTKLDDMVECANNWIKEDE